MKITYSSDCDAEWRATLSSWQRRELAALHRQGRHLPDRTDHGSDMRWSQAGVKTCDSFGNWRRNDRRSGHERVFIERNDDFGFVVLFLRRKSVFLIDPDTAVFTEVEGWVLVERTFVSEDYSSNFDPRTRSRIGGRR